MRGSLKKKENGIWAIRIDVGRDPETKRRRQKYFTVRGNKSDAEKKMRELLALYDGWGAGSDNVTVAQYLTRWITDYGPNLSPRGLDRYTTIVNKYLIPELGDIKLTRLRPENIQAHYSRAAQTLAPATVRYHHAVIHKALDIAVRWGLIIRNPADAVIVPPKKGTVIMQTWDEQEMGTYLLFIEDTPYHALFHTALHTGMRRSELLGLRWTDIDIAGKVLSVNRGLIQTRDNKFHYSDTKSKTSRHTIALTGSNAEVLKKHREAMTARALLNGHKLKPDSLVFSHEDGSPMRPNSVTRTWEVLTRKAGLRVIRLHDARHTHASLLLKQGVHPKIVQERLGHSSIQMTLDLYSHVVPGLQEQAAENFDRLTSNW